MLPVANTIEIKAEKRGHAPKRERFISFLQALKDLKGGGAFPWKPTLKDRVRQYFISQKLQMATQIAVAQIWSSIFTFARQAFYLTGNSNMQF